MTPELIFEALNSLSFCKKFGFFHVKDMFECHLKKRYSIMIQSLYYNNTPTYSTLFRYEYFQFLNTYYYNYYNLKVILFAFNVYNNYFKMFLVFILYEMSTILNILLCLGIIII